MSKCTRCGKERIFESSYTETVDKSTAIYTLTICPDAKCQEVVEKGLVEEKARRKIMRDAHEKRAEELALKRKGVNL